MCGWNNILVEGEKMNIIIAVLLTLFVLIPLAFYVFIGFAFYLHIKN